MFEGHQPVTLQERMARAAAVVETEVQTARERLAVALQTMGYGRAPDFQKLIARLESEARQLKHQRRGRLFKIRPASCSGIG